MVYGILCVGSVGKNVSRVFREFLTQRLIVTFS